MRENSRQRNSSFELLRVIAQIIIIFYHLVWAFTENFQSVYPIYKGVQMPIHVGVLLFVLLSGYFGIRPKVTGIANILLRAFVYYTPFAILGSIHDMGRVNLRDFLFLSHTPFWYIRTYLILCLLAPAINEFLEKSSDKRRYLFIFLLAFFSSYIGVQNTDVSLSEGKNIINFLCLYSIGYELKQKYSYIITFKLWKIIVVYLSTVIIQMVTWLYVGDKIKEIIFSISYSYCGIVLILQSILLFMIFMKLKIRSVVINKLGASVLGIYMLHITPFVFYRIIGKGANAILSLTGAELFSTFLLFFVYSIFIFCVCCCIDTILQKIINPLLLKISYK